MSENKKICGLLIENVVKQNKLQKAIIGIGLNVNQLEFENMPQASSMQNITGINYSLNEILVSLIAHLKSYFIALRQNEMFRIKQEYESFLFRKDKPSTFRDAEGNLFSGFIKIGVRFWKASSYY